MKHNNYILTIEMLVKTYTIFEHKLIFKLIHLELLKFNKIDNNNNNNNK